MTGPARHGMSGPARVLLYNTAIQSGLRSNELRSLTRGRLVCNANPPFITCKAGNTKNCEMARQFIQPELAADLRAHITAKAPQAPVFNLPHETDMAGMLRADLAEARRLWIKEAVDDPDEYAQRKQSDFLLRVNHEGEILDFHALRHTCGAWMAMATWSLQDGANGDASFDHHADDEHLRAPVPGPRGRCGGPDA